MAKSKYWKDCKQADCKQTLSNGISPIFHSQFTFEKLSDFQEFSFGMITDYEFPIIFDFINSDSCVL